MPKPWQKKIWFFTGPRKVKPNGPIVLGNIITDEREPDRAKNQTPPPPIDWNLDKREFHEDNKSIGLDKRNKYSVVMFASYAQMAFGPGISVQYAPSSQKSDSITCDRVDQTLFTPDEAYIRMCLEDSAVKKYCTSFGANKPLYMISGIAIARGASRALQLAKDKDMSLQVSVDTTLVTGMPSVGAKIGQAPGRTYTMSYDSSSDFVLGVALTIIKVKKDGTFSFTPHDKADFLSSENPSAPVDLSTYRVEILDATADDFEDYEDELQQGLDANGNECDFIYIKG